MTETPETRAKLAGVIRDLESKGDTQTIKSLVSAYKTKYQGGVMETSSSSAKKPVFSQPENDVQRQNKINKIQAETAKYKKEQEEFTRPGGMATAFGKGVRDTIASSEVALGNTLRKVFGNQRDTYTDSIQNVDTTQVQTLKAIQKARAEGKDTSKLERLYNEGQTNVGGVREDFTKENALPTTREVVGQLGGVALDVLSAGTYGNAAKGMKAGQLASKAPSIITPAKEGLKFFGKKTAKEIGIGGGVGYGYDVAQNLQDGETGAGIFKPGVGTAIGLGVPALGRGAPALRKTAQEFKTNRIAQEVSKVDDLAGKIVQGTTDDVDKARRALSDINVEGIKTFDDLKTALDDKVEAMSSTLDVTLGKDQQTRKLSQLSKAEQVGDKTIKHNFVEDALDQLEEINIKTSDFVGAEKIKQLRAKAKSEGLTIKEINDIAKEHGVKLNAFNANGEAATGLTKQAAENTRKGLKSTARELFDSPIYKEVDSAIADTLRTKDLIEKMVERVNVLAQKIQTRSLGQKVGRLIFQVANLFSAGALKGATEAALGRGAGLKTLNALDLEKQLNKNLQKLQQLIDTDPPESVMIKMLENIIKDESSLKGLQKPQSALPASQLNTIKAPNTPKKTTIASKLPRSPGNAIFKRAPGLTIKDRGIETKAYEKIRKSEDKILSEYETKHGKIVNTDNFRPFFKDVGYIGSNSAAVQEPSSYLAKKAFTQALKNDGKYMSAFAGGSGVGKTHATKGIPKVSRLKTNSAVILDSNFSSYDSAIAKIKEAEKAGKKFRGVFVYRDPVESLVEGVVKRMKRNPDEMGRLVPTEVVAGNHIDSWNVVKRLVKEGRRFVFLDNSVGKKAKLVTFEDLEKKIKYPSKEELIKLFNQRIKELLESGEISPEQYKGYIN